MNALSPREKEELAFFPPVSTDTPDQARLRATLNGHCVAIVKAMDGACRLRTAPPESQKIRHMVRHKLRDVGLNALHAYSLTKPEA